jgi:GT2 family glycosyltransferase
VSGFPKVVAVMLAHNPDPITLGRAVSAVESQTLQPESLVIVDNGSVRAVRVPAPWLTLRLDRNLGVGAGHNIGWRHALDTTDAVYVWSLEHDSVPDPDCLERLVNVALTAQADVAAFKPLQHEGTPTHGGAPQTTTKLSFNGLLLPVTTIRQLGFLREDFFVGQEDRDFGARLQMAGLRILKVPAAGVEHANKGVARRGEVSVPRHYYSKRNLVYRRHGESPLPIRFAVLVLESARVLGSLFVRRPYRRSLRRTAARLWGTWDGVLGRLGQRNYWFMSD